METNLRLSEAIRLGSMLGPQSFGTLFCEDGGSCALGAALRAIGSDISPHWKAIGPKLPLLLARADHPFNDAIQSVYVSRVDQQSEVYEGTLWSVIVSLNNTHRWTRERIADWVETIEREMEAKQAEAAEQVLVLK